MPCCSQSHPFQSRGGGHTKCSAVPHMTRGHAKWCMEPRKQRGLVARVQERKVCNIKQHNRQSPMLLKSVIITAHTGNPINLRTHTMHHCSVEPAKVRLSSDGRHSKSPLEHPKSRTSNPLLLCLPSTLAPRPRDAALQPQVSPGGQHTWHCVWQRVKET